MKQGGTYGFDCPCAGSQIFLGLTFFKRPLSYSSSLRVASRVNYLLAHPA